MIIKSISLKNFKGIKSLTIEPNGANINIYGDNATGKTTVFDAFNWILFGKDSLNRADFGIKPLDKQGNDIHNLESSVESVIENNGQSICLKKVFKEKWTKSRGKAETEFSGHTTDYFIDDVPVSQKDYTEKINSIAQESTFKLLTNPLYFNENLHWKERRALLLRICGDITDDEVMSENNKLAGLKNILGGHSIDDYKKILAAKRTKINEELERIPVRIDEVESGKPNNEGMSFEALLNQIDDLRLQQETNKKVISDIDSGTEVSNKERRVVEISTDIIKLKNTHQEKKDAALVGLKVKRSMATDEYDELQRSGKNLKSENESCTMELERLKRTRQLLIDSFCAEDMKEFTYAQEEVCPTCGQALPVEKLAEARETAITNFNQVKATRLEGIRSEGKATAVLRVEKQKRLIEIQNELDSHSKELDRSSEALTAINEEINKVQVGIEAVETSEYIAKMAQKNQIELEIKEIKEGNKGELEKLKLAINEAEYDIRLYQTEYAKKEQLETANQRIAELEDKEKELAANYEKLEGELFLTEEFTRSKVGMLEERINSKFKCTKFRMFNAQVNGGLDECCEALGQNPDTGSWVPYSGGLNSGSRINCGLDIINTLSDYFNFSPPIFCDNRESVTKPATVKAETISLIVSEKDKKLRIEVVE